MERTSANQYGYIASYKGKRFDVYTDKGIYAAQLLAAEYFKVPANKSHQVFVKLCERPNGEDVIHVPDF
jgi:hypothetical protein